MSRKSEAWKKKGKCQHYESAEIENSSSASLDLGFGRKTECVPDPFDEATGDEKGPTTRRPMLKPNLE